MKRVIIIIIHTQARTLYMKALERERKKKKIGGGSLF